MFPNSGEEKPPGATTVTAAQTAIAHAKSLERLERSRGVTVDTARRVIARKLRVGFGTFEHVVRGRVKRLDVIVRDRLQALLVHELGQEVRRLAHELEMVRRSGSRMDSESVREIEAHLEAVKSLLKR
jgi:hypothetical protein